MRISRPGASASGHLADADLVPRRERGEPFAHQVEVGDAVDLVIIGDPPLAIAKTDLRPHIQFDTAAA